MFFLSGKIFFQTNFDFHFTHIALNRINFHYFILPIWCEFDVSLNFLYKNNTFVTKFSCAKNLWSVFWNYSFRWIDQNCWQINWLIFTIFFSLFLIHRIITFAKNIYLLLIFESNNEMNNMILISNTICVEFFRIMKSWRFGSNFAENKLKTWITCFKRYYLLNY